MSRMISKFRSSAFLYHGSSPSCHDLAGLVVHAGGEYVTVAVAVAVAVAILPWQYPDDIALFVLIGGM